jgi:hypothetical protein
MLNTRYLVADMSGLPIDLASRGKQLLGSALAPIQTYRWRRFIQAYPTLAEIASNSSHFAARIHKPYLAKGLTCAKRVDLLMRHYRLALDMGLGHLMRMASLQPWPICDFAGKSGTRYQLVFSAADRQRLDGEFVLRLKTGSACVYTAAFSLAEGDDGTNIHLGGLHGMLAVDDALCIKNITRDFYGWRPREMMVSIVREIGTQLGCTHIVLASNANRLPSEEKRICKKSSDYDRTWKEMRATARSDGNFQLACGEPGTSTDEPESAAGQRQCLPLRENFRRTVLADIGRHIAIEKNTGRLFP